MDSIALTFLWKFGKSKVIFFFFYQNFEFSTIPHHLRHLISDIRDTKFYQLLPEKDNIADKTYWAH